MNDFEIIEAIRQGSPEYFKELVDKYKEMVFRVCLGFVRNRQDAEDTTQDVFFTVYKNIKNFRSESKLSTWIYRIAVNRSLNHIRKRKYAKIFSKADLEKENDINNFPAGENSAADFKVISKEKMKIILKALDKLPSNQRTAFTLFNLKGFTYEEIAEITGCSIPAVESRIHRAKMNLQKRLVKYFKEIL